MNAKPLRQLALCWIVLGGSASAQSPSEAQCRQMLTAMLQFMQETPAHTERERRDQQQLSARVEQLLSERREGRLSECEAWAALSKIVTTQ